MTGEPAGVAIVTLGCKVNQAESEALAEQVGGTAASEDDARVVVINTCTVTGEADRKARKAIRHALALPQSPTVVVTGCLAAVDPESLLALGDRVVVEPDRALVPLKVRERTGVPVMPGAPAAARTRTRVQVKVEDGCDAFCTYCIVPYARGVPRSVRASTIIGDVGRLAASGVAEVILTGINIGRYDDAGLRLPHLIEAVSRTGIRRIRLSSIEPGDVTDALLDAAARIEAFCPHLHVPLQSGSDAVLERMGRPYSSAEYAGMVSRVRAVMPGVSLTTDVIVGFPGESEDEFSESLAFVEEQAFSRLHVFRYSRRRGTVAATMSGQVEPPVRMARSSAMRVTGDRLARAFAESRLGTTAELLVERSSAAEGAPVIVEGTTREYLRVKVPRVAAVPGDVLGVRIERVAASGVITGRSV